MNLSEIFSQLTRVAGRSPDMSTQNAACLIDEDWDPVAWGFNGFPEGLRETRARLEDRFTKRSMTEHAERACLFGAFRENAIVPGMTMVTLWASCPDCARAIIASGISAVICHRETQEATPDRWALDVGMGLAMLIEAGVSIVQYSGPVADSTPFLFDGSMRYLK